ncbi:MAG: hypothetical protein PHQ60_12390 [Sideroxydans sp.]|nr:hypothetical protein [Sideroxydans sp.]
MKRWLVAPIVMSVSLFSGAAENNWPFDQPKNSAVITLKQIVVGKAQILRVTHDANDHGWQFLNPNIEVIESNASVVSLEQIVKLDPSILELANLPPGWSAWRTKVGEKWVKEKLPIQR